MICTEKEAAEKWCPHVRYANSQDTLWSNRGDSNGFNGCIGSRCMAWRDGTYEHLAWRKPDGTLHIVRTMEQHAIAKASERDHGWLPVGYCGLAGKP